MALHCPFILLSTGNTVSSILGEPSEYFINTPVMMSHEKRSLIERSDEYTKRGNVRI